MTTLGRPESFRIAYQAALHDLAAMAAERDALKARLAWSDANALKWEQNTRESAKACVDVTKRYAAERDTATARADAAEAEVKRLRAFVAENGEDYNDFYTECLACHGRWMNTSPEYHKEGCIVAEARQAQKEAPHD